MAQNTIYPQGTVEVTVPAAQSIAISNFGGGIAKIYYLIEDANRPDAYQFQQSLNDSSVTLGAFSVATTVKIEAGNSKVFYDIAASPDTGVGDADTLNGKASDTGDTADTIAARDGSGDLTANAFISTVATGTAPLTVASTTVVTNLNADLLDNLNSATASTASTIAARDASGNLTANVLISDVATGTAPLTVASTTVVTNLNADLLDGTSSASFLRSDTADQVNGALNFTQPPTFDNLVGINVKEAGGTARRILYNDNLDVFHIGNGALATDIQSDGTLTYNGASLASGSIDTTAAQTITVVDGLITNIA